LFIGFFAVSFSLFFPNLNLLGLLDMDVYGPSLPILVNPSDPAVRRSNLGDGMIMPISHEGVKLLSLGFVSPKVNFNLFSTAKF